MPAQELPDTEAVAAAAADEQLDEDVKPTADTTTEDDSMAADENVTDNDISAEQPHRHDQLTEAETTPVSGNIFHSFISYIRVKFS